MITDTKSQAQRLEQRRQVVSKDKASAEALLREKAYALTVAELDHPDRVGKLKEEVSALQRTIAGLVADADRIDSALQTLAARDRAAVCRSELEEKQQRAEHVRQQGKRMAALVSKLLTLIDGLGPVLAELDTVQRQRSNDASLFVQRMGRIEDRQRFQQAVEWRDGLLAQIVGVALWRSGLGSRVFRIVGVDVSAPDRTAGWSTTDPHTAIVDAIKGYDQLVDVGLDALISEYRAQADAAEELAHA